jgi:hypothetical protein
MSIPVRAISVQVSSSAAAVYHTKPNFQATSADRIAVASSTSG